MHGACRQGPPIATVARIVMTLGPATSPQDGTRPGRDYFVGRRELLEQLYNTVFESVKTGTGRVVTLVGATGVGKTRLTEELLSILDSGGRPMRVYGQSLGDASGSGFLPQYLRKRFKLDQMDNASVMDQLDQIGLAMSDIVPQSRADDALRLLGVLLGLHVGHNGDPTPGFDPDIVTTERFQQRATKTAFNLLRYDVSRRPHLFVLDDWDRAARPADRETVRQLARMLADRPACFLTTARQPLKEGLDIAPPGLASDFEVPPLDSGDMRRLVAGMLENVDALPDAVVDNTVEQSAGNPSLGRELVRLLMHRGVIAAEPTADKSIRWLCREDSYEPGEMPADVSESVKERLEGLAELERGLLEAAAIFGQTFWVRGVISLVRAGMADAAERHGHLGNDPVGMKLDGAIMGMVDRGLFGPLDEPVLLKRQAAMEFGGAEMRDAALESLSPERREHLHRLAGQWIGSCSPIERGLWLEVRAGHLEAGHVGREAAKLYGEAGDICHKRNNQVRARELYQRGLGLVGVDTARTAAGLLARLAQTYLETSDYEEAERCLYDQLHFALLIDDKRRLGRAHVALGEVFQARSQYDRGLEQIDYGQEVLSQAGDEAGIADAKEARARLMCQQGVKDAYTDALAVLNEALKLRKRMRDPLGTARTLTALANVTYATGRLEDAIRLYQEALVLRERHGDKHGAMLALNGLGVAKYDNGQHQDALKCWKRALRLAEEVGDRHQHAVLLTNLAEQKLESGDLEAAAPLLEQAMETAEELGIQRLTGLIQALLSGVALKRGKEARALELAEKSLENGYAIESKQVLGHALLAKARCQSNALFIDSPDDEARQRSASDSFQNAIALLEDMGEKPTLLKALHDYGTFLVERGVMEKGQKAIERAQKLQLEMRSPDGLQDTFHEGRTIRRSYPTGPMDRTKIEMFIKDVRKGKTQDT